MPKERMEAPKGFLEMSKAELAALAEEKLKKLFPDQDISAHRSTEQYLYFPVIEQYFLSELIDGELLDDLRSGQKLLSVGVGDAMLERLLVEGFGVDRQNVICADIEIDPHLDQADLSKIKFDLREGWPFKGGIFKYIIFPESFGVAHWGSARTERHTHRFYKEVGAVVNEVMGKMGATNSKHNEGPIDERDQKFVLQLLEHDLPIAERKLASLSEACTNLTDDGEIRMTGSLINDQELTLIYLKLKEIYPDLEIKLDGISLTLAPHQTKNQT